MRSNFDTPWKLVLEGFFKNLVEFLFPEIAGKIDWSKPHQFLDKELLSIQKNTKVGNRLADKLIKVYTKQGKEVWVIIHVEVQGAYESKFSERMWQYYYRIYDKYQMPLLSVAILTDKNPKWRPNRFQRQLWGCDLSLKFPIVKLLDFAPEMDKLSSSNNPIAKVLEAHLTALESRGNITLRLESKLNLVKKLYSLGYKKDELRILFAFFDYAMTLPIDIEKKFMDNMLRFEEENGNMQYITSVERISIETGREDGGRKILRLMLEQKFGHLGNDVLEQLASANLEQLEKMAYAFLAAMNIEELLHQFQNMSSEESMALHL